MGSDGIVFKTLTAENLAAEHICCAITGAQHAEGVGLKKDFLAAGLGKGLVFRKLDVRGKVFIEYAPWDQAWRPVAAPSYVVIHCLWVSGRFKGRSFGRQLLEHCLAEGARHHGVVAVSGRMPYLTDTRFFVRHGFEVVESTETGFDLVCFRPDREEPLPRFARPARQGRVAQTEGVHFEYAYQCPFVPKCVAEMAAVARSLNLDVSERELRTAREAQQAASPFGTFGAFLYGRLITHELMSPNKFRRLLERELAT